MYDQVRMPLFCSPKGQKSGGAMAPLAPPVPTPMAIMRQTIPSRLLPSVRNLQWLSKSIICSMKKRNELFKGPKDLAILALLAQMS